MILKHAGRLPGPECGIFIAQIGGAMSRVADSATAFPQRKAHFVSNVHTRWRAPADDRKCVQWARDFFQATAPHAAGTAYVNFMPEDEIDRVRSAYGPNYDRLARAKAQYDRSNFFRLNQNIQPAS